MAEERNPEVLARARSFLAKRFSARWDRECLEVDGNGVDVEFDPDVADRNGEILLLYIAVAVPGERLGGRVIDALRDFSQESGIPVFIGPCVNHDYWHCPDGRHPLRHPWLEEVGDEHGDPVYGYRPAAALPGS